MLVICWVLIRPPGYNQTAPVTNLQQGVGGVMYLPHGVTDVIAYYFIMCFRLLKHLCRKVWTNWGSSCPSSLLG